MLGSVLSDLGLHGLPRPDCPRINMVAGLEVIFFNVTWEVVLLPADDIWNNFLIFLIKPFDI